MKKKIGTLCVLLGLSLPFNANSQENIFIIDSHKKKNVQVCINGDCLVSQPDNEVIDESYSLTNILGFYNFMVYNGRSNEITVFDYNEKLGIGGFSCEKGSKISKRSNPGIYKNMPCSEEYFKENISKFRDYISYFLDLLNKKLETQKKRKIREIEI